MVPAAVVAEAIATRRQVTRTDLQCLLYLCQGFAVAWRGTPLFTDAIEARAGGPEVLGVGSSLPQAGKSALSDGDASIVEAVLDFFSDRDGAWLTALAQRGSPWRSTYHANSPAVVIPLHVLGPCFRTIASTPAALSAPLKRGLDVIVDTPIEELDRLLSDEASPNEELEAWLASSNPEGRLSGASEGTVSSANPPRA